MTTQRTHTIIAIYTVVLLIDFIVLPFVFCCIIVSFIYNNRLVSLVMLIFFLVQIFLSMILYHVFHKLGYGRSTSVPAYCGTDIQTFEEIRTICAKTGKAVSIEAHCVVMPMGVVGSNETYLFCMDCSDQTEFKVEDVAIQYMNQALEHNCLGKGTYEHPAAYIHLFFVTQAESCPDLMRFLHKNAASSIYTFVVAIEASGKFCVPTYFGFTSFWEKHYLQKIKQLCRILGIDWNSLRTNVTGVSGNSSF